MSRSRKTEEDKRTRRGMHCGKTCPWCRGNRLHPRVSVEAAATFDLDEERYDNEF